ncbi:MAG: 5-(carboxyamino)imidazole ribonucleotide mutase [Actinobacteria bacterium]|nr:5-(carboxyamino)imidazole ribonucleotide mutase [Actinomycetota bacterium]
MIEKNNKKGARVAIMMGSVSDRQVMDAAADILGQFGIDYEVKISSAHRMPNKTREFVLNAENEGFEVIIAGAGKSAHLPGVIASYTTIPVIGVPVKTDDLGGLDSLLSIVQMPPGVPVATVAINGSKNAALLAVQILGLKYPDIKNKFREYKKGLEHVV